MSASVLYTPWAVVPKVPVLLQGPEGKVFQITLPYVAACDAEALVGTANMIAALTAGELGLL